MFTYIIEGFMISTATSPFEG